jgi:predicted acylesterase/phospholipase RssA
MPEGGAVHNITAVVASFLLVCSLHASSADTPIDHDKCPGTNRILVTGGGGTRGAYQVGALWYLIKIRHCDFQHFAGTSTGALTAAVLASARNANELGKNVEILVDVYRDLRSADDIVSKKSPIPAQVLLPKNVGGTQGMYSLAPLMARIAKRRIDLERAPREKLTIPVVSLQRGPLHTYEVYSMLDLIIGSASIPIAVEPRVARIWTMGDVHAIEGDVVTIRTDKAPGLADKDCVVRLYAGVDVHRCSYVSTAAIRHESVSGSVVEASADAEWEVRLRVPLTPRQRAELATNIDTAQKAALTDNLPPTLPKTQFTGVHQLVDGGVADNLPLFQAFGVWSEGEGLSSGRYDAIFAISTGTTIPSLWGNTEASGALDVAKRSLDVLWTTLQDTSSRWAMAHASSLELADEAQRLSRDVMRHMRALKTRMGEKEFDAFVAASPPPDTKHIRDLAEQAKNDDLNKEMGIRRTPPVPRLYILEPGRSVFNDTLEVDANKISIALYDGCIMAAAFDFGAARNSQREIIRSTEERPECAPLRPRFWPRQR